MNDSFLLYDFDSLHNISDDISSSIFGKLLSTSILEDPFKKWETIISFSDYIYVIIYLRANIREILFELYRDVEVN